MTLSTAVDSEAPLPPPRARTKQIPDLLSPLPCMRLDVPALQHALTSGFATGVPESVFDDILERAALPPSTWDPAYFAHDLFLDEFVATCFHVTIDRERLPVHRSWLVRVLSSPPSSRATVDYRRAILSELTESPDMRRQLEQIYLTLVRLRSQFVRATLSPRVGVAERRLDILATAKKVVDMMAAAFAHAKSGLARLRDFGTQVQQTDAYRRLADLLDYDDHLAKVDIRLRLGSDGRIRELEVLAAQANNTNRFYHSWLGRFWNRLLLWMHGYHFSNGEVMARLSDEVAQGIEHELGVFFQLLGDMELYLAGLAFRDVAQGRGLHVCLPDLIAPDADALPPAPREVRGLFNPLLLSSCPNVVPCDLVTQQHAMTLILTGPNSGGKTRLLQSIALAQILAQTGLFVPASRAQLRWANGLFASFIQPPNVEQVEGRLGTELLRIRSLFEKVGTGDMVVIDELCSGTNPSEGQEMFQLVISLLAQLHPQAFIITHFLQLAAELRQHPPVEHLAFRQVEIDANQRPTYQFIEGVAATSLAYRTAARLGVTRQELAALVDTSKRARAKGDE